MQKQIYLKNKQGFKLSGVLSAPSDDINNSIVILCHGFPSSKKANSMVSVEKALNDKNIASFRFDFFGQGESEGEFENITLSEWVDEVLIIEKYLKTLGYKKIGLFGSSSGGGVAIMAAAKMNDLFALVLKAPAVDHVTLEIAERGEDAILRWKEKGIAYVQSSGGKFQLKYDFFEDAKKNIGYEIAKKISAPTLILHGDNDVEVPLKQSLKVSEIIPDCRLEIFKDADHKFSNQEDFEKMIIMIAEFFSEKAK